ncbi:MAG TPA: hypothetical protein VKU80_18015 [Planctomycetota bacterium]|nr:hypothetical protein [Planctomycetota bacterium]
MEETTFRLFRNGRAVHLSVVGDHHWKITSASEATGFEIGDEVSPVEKMSWKKAKRRVNSTRTALSPNRLVLLRGSGCQRTDDEVAEILRIRPWDPTTPPAA